MKLEIPIEKNIAHLMVKDKECTFLVDSGTHISCISLQLVREIFGKKHIHFKPSQTKNVVGVCGEIHHVLGTLDLNITFDNLIIPHTFHVFARLHQPAIIGIDFLSKHNAKIDLEHNVLILSKDDRQIPLISSVSPCGIARVTNDFTIDPKCDTVIPVHISHVPKHRSAVANLFDSQHVLGSKCLVTIENGQTCYRVLNPYDVPMFIPARPVVAVAHPVGKVSTDIGDLLTSESEDHLPHVGSTSADQTEHDTDHYIELANSLGFTLEDSQITPEQKRKVLAFIGNYRSSFAQDISELGCNDAFLHRIETGDAPP